MGGVCAERETHSNVGVAFNLLQTIDCFPFFPSIFFLLPQATKSTQIENDYQYVWPVRRLRGWHPIHTYMCVCVSGWFGKFKPRAREKLTKNAKGPRQTKHIAITTTTTKTQQQQMPTDKWAAKNSEVGKIDNNKAEGGRSSTVGGV